MKSKKLAILFVCTSLLAFTANSAPSNVREIEIVDSATVMNINQDENELTQVSVKLGKEKHEFTFTPAELKDPAVIKSKLAELPEKPKKTLTKLLTKLTAMEHRKFAQFHSKELDAKTRKKLETIAKKMEGKEAEMQRIAMKLEAKAAEMEAHAMEFEVLHQQQEDEYAFIVESIEGNVADIVSEFGDLDIDIDFAHDNGHGNRIVIINGHDEDEQAEHLIKMIKNSNLTDEDKQAIKEALN
jgi:hypothetical protein